MVENDIFLWLGQYWRIGSPSWIRFELGFVKKKSPAPEEAQCFSDTGLEPT